MTLEPLVDALLADEAVLLLATSQGDSLCPLRRLVPSNQLTRRERWLYLLGNALWVIVSGNNHVVDPSGLRLVFGTWRTAARRLAALLTTRCCAVRSVISISSVVSARTARRHARCIGTCSGACGR